MKNFKVSCRVIKPFNDTKVNPVISYEIDEELILDRFRHEELYAKGFVDEGKKIEEKTNIRRIKTDEE